MFLKRIKVSGFKSFADPIDLDFGPGVTCIVGPNGCGKSTDAVAMAYVLHYETLSIPDIRERALVESLPVRSL